VSPYRITPLAEADLENIGDHIAQDNPRRALSYVVELRAQCQKIAQAPLIYRARGELRDGLRSCAHGNHVIFFSADESSVLIVRILNGAQDVQALVGEQ
jgi:toxin ParE1/3/4